VEVGQRERQLVSLQLGVDRSTSRTDVYGSLAKPKPANLPPPTASVPVEIPRRRRSLDCWVKAPCRAEGSESNEPNPSDSPRRLSLVVSYEPRTRCEPVFADDPRAILRAQPAHQLVGHAQCHTPRPG